MPKEIIIFFTIILPAMAGMGQSPRNKLYYNNTTGMISGNTDSQYDNIATQASSLGKSRGAHPYILTQVRKSKKIQ